jgi:hypothetical protein
VSQWSVDVVRGVLGDGGQGHDGAERMDESGVRGWGHVESRRMGQVASESY